MLAVDEWMVDWCVQQTSSFKILSNDFTPEAFTPIFPGGSSMFGERMSCCLGRLYVAVSPMRCSLILTIHLVNRT